GVGGGRRRLERLDVSFAFRVVYEDFWANVMVRDGAAFRGAKRILERAELTMMSGRGRHDTLREVAGAPRCPSRRGEPGGPPLTDLSYLPVTEPDEVRSFVRRLPLAVDTERFVRFALGFPHRYLANTSPVEVVRHYGLMEGLGRRGVITSLAREEARWRLCLVSRDRSFLFSRIAGTLLAFGMDILSAEA